MNDHLGNPVTPCDPATLRGIDAFIHGFLAYTNEAVDILPPQMPRPNTASPTPMPR